MSYKREHEGQADHAVNESAEASQLAPGKRTLVERELGAVQRKRHASGSGGNAQATSGHDPWAGLDAIQYPPGSTAEMFRDVVEGMRVADVQRRGGGNQSAEDVQRAAARGISGSSGTLPFLDQIQRSFGAHDVSNVKAHTDGVAAEGAAAMGAEAYATGDHVVFAGTPSLHTAAHEAAHVVQQRAGVQLKGGVGAVGDAYEQNADGVADRVVQGQSAADLLDAFAPRGTGCTAVQRKENSAKDDADGSAEAAGRAADNANADGQTGNKTVPLNLTALYEDVPGAAKDKIRRAKDKDALWFDPLNMYSHHPQGERKTKAVGVASGGEQMVDTYQAPVTEGASPVGRGSITATLKYTKERNSSFSVDVTGIIDDKNGRKRKSAEKKARPFVEAEITEHGDIEQIAAAATEMVRSISDDHAGAKVSISVRPNKVTDEGKSTFFYKVRGPAGVLMEVAASETGAKKVTSRSSTTSDKSHEDETRATDHSERERVDVTKRESHSRHTTATSKETERIAYNEAVLKTIDDYVTKATEAHDEVSQKLANKVVSDSTYRAEDHEEIHTTSRKVEDYTKNVKRSTESGERDKDNWAAKAKKVVNGVKKVTSIPYVDKLPGVGWFTRKVKEWYLDIAEWGLDQFEETGKVKFTDTKEDTTSKNTTTGNDDTTKDRDRTVTRHDETTTKDTLERDFKSKMKDQWERHMTEVSSVRKEYSKVIDKDSETTDQGQRDESTNYERNKDEQEREEKRKVQERKTTTASFEVTSKTTFSKPVVKAHVTSGDAEVSNAPFPPESTSKKKDE